MKVINLSLADDIMYPVGPFIQHNLPIIRALIKEIKKLRIQRRIVFCCSGSSGAIIAAIASNELPSSVIFHVKKEGEIAHSYKQIEFLEDDYIIIIDDMICTGKTVVRIKNEIEKNLIDSGIETKVHCIALASSIGEHDLIDAINPDVLILNDKDDPYYY